MLMVRMPHLLAQDSACGQIFRQFPDFVHAHPLHQLEPHQTYFLAETIPHPVVQFDIIDVAAGHRNVFGTNDPCFQYFAVGYLAHFAIGLVRLEYLHFMALSECIFNWAYDDISKCPVFGGILISFLHCVETGVKPVETDVKEFLASFPSPVGQVFVCVVYDCISSADVMSVGRVSGLNFIFVHAFCIHS